MKRSEVIARLQAGAELVETFPIFRTKSSVYKLAGTRLTKTQFKSLDKANVIRRDRKVLLGWVYRWVGDTREVI